MFTAILDNIQIFYSVNSIQVDSAILDALNRERCYKANKASNDTSIPKLVILERRIRIGIHNGLCYVEEPLYLLLSDAEPLGRRRSRSLSRGSKGSITQNLDFYRTPNSARLRKLCADERFAIVFAIDYLVGVEKTENYVTDAQLIMICWNAWCPYQNGSFTLADTINVPLVGGPRCYFK
jgi:nephrocystin-4